MDFGIIKSIISIWILTASVVGTEKFIFKTVGIYSECVSQKNRTEFSKIATLIRKYVDIWANVITHDRTGRPYEIRAQTHNFDVCYNRTLLFSLINDLILDEQYFIQEENKPYKTSHIAAIFTYIPDSMNQLLKPIMYDIPIYDSKFQETLQNEYKQYTRFLVELTRELQWENVLLVSLLTEIHTNFINHQYYLKSIEAFKDERFCVSIMSIDPRTWSMNHNNATFSKSLDRYS